MTPLHEQVVKTLQARFPGAVLGTAEYCKQLAVTVAAGEIIPILRTLRDDAELGFTRLADLCGVDYLDRGEAERYGVIYHLHSLKHQLWIRIRALVPERHPELDTVVALWPCAEWLEREVWDLYGIRFRTHPDLRRILMPADYPAHPLRKDYPLRGLGERNQFKPYDPATPTKPSAPRT